LSQAFDPLQLYMNWILEGSLLRFRPPINAIQIHDKGLAEKEQLLGVILDRQGQFQTELFVVPPYIKKINAHTHPDVSSIEWSLAGDFVFTCDGFEFPFKSTGTLNIAEASAPIIVKNTSSHGAPIVNNGATFLSFQYWLNGIEPSSVGYNFDES